MTDKTKTPAATDSDLAATSGREQNIRRAGVAVGIGSAAVAAALLYANRRKDKRKG
ncbi:hypothetical protein WJT74_04310 [Sphingomicrobium sp. XHP0239]|uniref:hypothetical protein n=1 Tax=Sphingomicrobium maritimum TaxID=3133972 RepID=UPI0031CC4FAA